jgi:predicted transcriptional regulator
MGASKPNIFNNENERFAKISDAFGSHWRIEIINFIQKNETTTQENLIKHLKLKHSTVNHHLKKLTSANVITKTYYANGYLLNLNSSTLQDLLGFVSEKAKD